LAGWPWPLDGVQAWFEGLWTWIGEAASQAVAPVLKRINDSASWLYTQIQSGWDYVVREVKAAVADVSVGVGDAGSWLWTELTSAINDAKTILSGISATVGSAISGAIGTISSAVQGAIGWLTSIIWGWVDGALRWATDTFTWLRNEFTETGSWIVGEVQTMFDGAFMGLAGVFEEWPIRLWEGFSAPFIGAFDTIVGYMGGVRASSSPEIYVSMHQKAWWDGWPASIISDGLAGAFKRNELSGETFMEKAKHAYGLASPEWVEELTSVSEGYFKKIDTEYVQKLIAPPAGKSPISGEEAIKWGTGLVSTAIGLAAALWTAHMIAEAGSLGQLDGVNELYHNIMSATGLAAVSAAFLRVPLDVGILTPTRQFYNKMFTPEIPPAPDLVRMVVREAFDPKVVIEAPEDFAKYMEYAGYSKEWSNRYWTAHFLPIELRQAYENLWRGFWTKEQFMRALHIADVHPMWREDIYRVAYRPLSVRELRFGWEVGVVPPEKMVAAYRARGLTEEDAVIATEASIEYALHEERMGVLREWMKDLQDGLTDEDTVRANMGSIKIIGDRQDYYIARATIYRERYFKRDLLDLYRDGYMKDLITEEDLRDRVHEIIVIPDVADLFVEKAYVDKYKKPAPPRATEEDAALKELRKYQVTYAIQAYRRYAIEKDELVSMLVAAEVDPRVAAQRADYEELKRPLPKPSETEITRAKEQVRAQRLAELTAIEEFRKAVIDADTLYKRLIDLGYSEVLATAITQYELIRKMKAA